jgi:hypothetical protein
LATERVLAQAGLGHAAQAGDDVAAFLGVTQGDADGTLGALLDHLVGAQVVLADQDVHDLLLHAGTGTVDNLATGHDGVADAGQQIGDGIGHWHGVFLLFTSST